jgi:hypothetical protein
MTDTAAPAPAPNLDHEAPQSQSGGASAPLAEQLDIPMLDEYLQTLLLPQVDGMLQYLPWKARIPATIKLALLQFATLWISQGQTPATRALKLQLKLGSSPSSAPGVGPHTRPNKRQPMVSLVHQKIIVYAILSIGLPRLYQYTKDFVRMQQQQQQRPESTTLIPEDDIIDYETSMIQRLARERRRSTLETMFRVVDTAIPMIRLSLLLSCWSLYSRKKMTPMVPNLVMWLVGWQYTTNTTNTSSSQIIHGGIDTSSRQLLHVQHAHRRWLQEEGMRLVPMLITPLWNTCQESRDYLRACSRYVRASLKHTQAPATRI